MYNRCMRRLFFTATVLACLLVAEDSAAQNGNFIVPHDSRLHSLLNLVLAESGAPPFSAAGPTTLDEIRMALGQVDRSLLSEAGLRGYEYLRGYAAPALFATPAFAGNVSLGVDFEAYLAAEESPRWVVDYPDRKSLLTIDFEAYAAEVAYGLLHFDLREEQFAVAQADNVTNWPEDLTYVDGNFPYRALLSVGGAHWNLAIGRDRFSWGRGQSGRLILSHEAPYHDFFRVTGYWDVFKYTFGVIGFEPWLTTAEVGRGHDDEVEEYAKNLFLHRFEFVFFERLRFVITEGLMYGKRVPYLALLNPFLILHNLYIWEYASSASSIEIAFNPWRNMVLYGQFYMNQLQLQFEIDQYGADAVPNATAWMFGGHGYIPIGPGSLVIGFEGAITDPWLYIREHPLLSFFWRRRVTSNLLGRPTIVTDALGYGWGPDSAVVTGWVGYEIAAAINAEIELTWVRSGTQTVLAPYAEGPEAAAMRTPTEPTEDLVVVSAGAQVTPFPWLSLNVHLSWQSATNYQNQVGGTYQDFQAVLGVGFRLDGIIHGQAGEPAAGFRRR